MRPDSLTVWNLLIDDFNIDETYAAQEEALLSVWNDTRLDEYTDADGSAIENVNAGLSR